MNTTQFIEQAISRGETEGIEALGPREQVVFAVSEAEVLCDMEGIDSLLHKYGAGSMESLFAQAFAAIGAREIASALGRVATSEEPIAEHILSHANRLITERHGYTYESIQAYVQRGA